MPEVGRRVTVAPERIVRWVAGCESRHGPLSRSIARPGELLLRAADGFNAMVRPLLSQSSLDGEVVGYRLGSEQDDPLGRWVRPVAVTALILVRRGGYALGVAVGPRLVRHKVGTRYVQSRTAAGGWSQQRFARRRGNQADALVQAVQDHAVRVLFGEPGIPTEALLTGGDRTLVGLVLQDPRLRRLVPLARASLFDLPDPRMEVLKQALERGRAVHVELVDPSPAEVRATDPPAGRQVDEPGGRCS